MNGIKNYDEWVTREPDFDEPSKRGEDWEDFSEEVYNHIESYTVPQYGDKGTDQITNWTVEDCVKAIQKYCARHGRNSREGQDRLDLIKIAHYAQMAWDKAE
jgi:hypothetical protein